LFKYNFVHTDKNGSIDTKKQPTKIRQIFTHNLHTVYLENMQILYNRNHLNDCRMVSVQNQKTRVNLSYKNTDVVHSSSCCNEGWPLTSMTSSSRLATAGKLQAYCSGFLAELARDCCWHCVDFCDWNKLCNL